ncbi:MAG: YeeE/YedE family protein [Caulobacteraceae bacterium]
MTPLPIAVALSAGLLIGTAAALFMVLDGRIAGISGLSASLFRLGGETPWAMAAAFLIGLPIAAAAVRAGLHRPPILVADSPVVLIVAGLLVGVGTRLGNGCTSGHGVCGLARLSPRSAVATLVFMATAALTVFVARHGGL